MKPQGKGGKSSPAKNGKEAVRAGAHRELRAFLLLVNQKKFGSEKGAGSIGNVLEHLKIILYRGRQPAPIASTLERGFFGQLFIFSRNAQKHPCPRSSSTPARAARGMVRLRRALQHCAREFPSASEMRRR